VLDAARRGALTGPLAEHVDGCPSCARAAAVVAALREAAARFAAEARLPDADLLLWRAATARRHAAAERALRPLRWARRAAGAVAAGVAVSLGPLLLRTLQASTLPPVSKLVPTSGTAALVATSALLLAALVAALWVTWEET
jgi:hypothetical protein